MKKGKRSNTEKEGQKRKGFEYLNPPRLSRTVGLNLTVTKRKSACEEEWVKHQLKKRKRWNGSVELVENAFESHVD